MSYNFIPITNKTKKKTDKEDIDKKELLYTVSKNLNLYSHRKKKV